MATVPKQKQLNVLLDPEDRQRLAEIAKAEGLHASQIIRAMIRARHAIRCHGLPTCANSESCRCPQMHTLIQPAQPAPAVQAPPA